MRSRFENKTVLVTGGSTGIGLATAERLLAEGATVFITGRRQAELDKAVAELGERAIGVQGDITSHTDLARLFATIAERAGNLDAVVANAGGLVPLGEYTDALLDERFALNLKGTAFTVQGALPLLRRGASIVLLGSISGRAGMAGLDIYGATKCGPAVVGPHLVNGAKGPGLAGERREPRHLHHGDLLGSRSFRKQLRFSAALHPSPWGGWAN